MGYLITYIVPAIIVWGCLGLIFQLISGLLGIVVFITTFYALWFGLVEVLKLPVQPPGIHWQVPSKWLENRSTFTRVVIWGSLLGPGLVTRNPYAGMWILLWLVALSQNLVLAILVGAVHGATRAFGVLNNSRLLFKGTSFLGITAYESYWRIADGLFLLLIAGTLVSSF